MQTCKLNDSKLQHAIILFKCIQALWRVQIIERPDNRDPDNRGFTVLILEKLNHMSLIACSRLWKDIGVSCSRFPFTYKCMANVCCGRHSLSSVSCADNSEREYTCCPIITIYSSNQMLNPVIYAHRVTKRREKREKKVLFWAIIVCMHPLTNILEFQ